MSKCSPLGTLACLPSKLPGRPDVQVQGGVAANSSLEQLWGQNITDKLPDFSQYLTGEDADAQQDGLAKVCGHAVVEVLPCL